MNELNLKKLTSRELDKQAALIVGKEKKCVAQLIAHLAEIRERKLFLGLGYKSLFDYCVNRLGLSEAESWLRIHVSRACVAFPNLLQALADNQMSITVASKLAPKLTAENCDKLVADCKGMSKLGVEEYLAALQPKKPVTSGCRKAAQDLGKPQSLEIVLGFEQEKQLGMEPAATGSYKPKKSIEPIAPELYNFRFSGDKKLKEKLIRLGEVLGIQNPLQELELLINKLSEIGLDQKDPERKHARRLKRQQAKEEKQSKLRPDEAADNSQTAEKVKAKVAGKHRRAPRIALREELLAKANYQCEYMSPNGKRCTAKINLEIDHEVPWAKGGPSRSENLQCLCKAHNLLKAEHDFGKDFIQERMRFRRLTKSDSSRGCVEC